jgi:hypothetical protein
MADDEPPPAVGYLGATRYPTGITPMSEGIDWSAGITTFAAVPAARARIIFVAYPYSFPEADYRPPFKDLAKAFDVEFQFANEQITSKHILDKVTKMIADARFSLFDITTWNPNVALELGIAMGRGKDYYLLFNPTYSGPDVPADLGGLDRIQYTSYAELREGLTNLLAQEFGVRSEDRRADPVADLRERVLQILQEGPGLRIGDIANQLEVPINMAQVIVGPLVASGALETAGAKRGTRYYLRGQTPNRPPISHPVPPPA